MQPDFALVIGIVLAGLSLVGIMSALSDRRAPRASAITVLIAGGLILYALQTQPGGYTLEDVPNAFVRVISQLI
jgi:hypothetical protein